MTIRVAFLGPAGTFTEEALRGSSRAAGAERLPYATVWETVMAVHCGTAELAVVPIENSLEGSVAATLDTLAGEATSVRIVGEVVRSIRHCLVAREELPLSAIERVVSHPQATAQCARFLRDRLGPVERVSATSTAEAVRLVSETPGRPWAALGSRLAGELYGCVLLAEGVEDRDDNATRFVWLGRHDLEVVAAPGSDCKTTIVFWGFNDRSPGALVRVLGELAERGINLTKIESRPRRIGLGRYMFFADLEGGTSEPRVAEALSALERRVEALRVLGSYPRAGEPVREGAGEAVGAER